MPKVFDGQSGTGTSTVFASNGDCLVQVEFGAGASGTIVTETAAPGNDTYVAEASGSVLEFTESGTARCKFFGNVRLNATALSGGTVDAWIWPADRSQ